MSSSTKYCVPTTTWCWILRCRCTEPASWAHSSTSVKLGQHKLSRRRDWTVSFCAAWDAYATYDGRSRSPTRTCLSALVCPSSSCSWVNAISAGCPKTCCTGNFQKVSDLEATPDCDSKTLAIDTWRAHQSISSHGKASRIFGTPGEPAYTAGPSKPSNTALTTWWRREPPESPIPQTRQKIAHTCHLCGKDCHSRIDIHGHTRRCSDRTWLILLLI